MSNAAEWITCSTILSDPGSERGSGGTHRQHGIEEVSDERGSVLDRLLSLRQVGHRVTYMRKTVTSRRIP